MHAKLASYRQGNYVASQAFNQNYCFILAGEHCEGSWYAGLRKKQAGQQKWTFPKITLLNSQRTQPKTREKKRNMAD